MAELAQGLPAVQRVVQRPDLYRQKYLQVDQRQELELLERGLELELLEQRVQMQELRQAARARAGPAQLERLCLVELVLALDSYYLKRLFLEDLLVCADHRT